MKNPVSSRIRILSAIAAASSLITMPTSKSKEFEPKEKTQADFDALAAAQAKRDRKLAKRRKEEV